MAQLPPGTKFLLQKPPRNTFKVQPVTGAVQQRLSLQLDFDSHQFTFSDHSFASLFMGGHCSVLSFPAVFIWLCYGGNADSVTQVLRCFIFFHLRKHSGELTDASLKSGSRLGLLACNLPKTESWSNRKLNQNRIMDNEIESVNKTLLVRKRQNRTSPLHSLWIFYYYYHKLYWVLK